MSTIDMNSVAGFKAVDAEGNELGIMSMADITAAVKESIMQDAAMARSVATLSEASTLAASDTYEDKLPQQTDLKWARGLDTNGNPILISKESLASVVGELIGPATSDKAGLMTSLTMSNNIIYQASQYRLWLLYDVKDTYMIKGAEIVYMGPKVTGEVIISSYNDAATIKHSATKSGDISPMKLYERDGKVYLYSNQTGSYTKVFIRSCDNIEQVGSGQQDMAGYNQIYI